MQAGPEPSGIAIIGIGCRFPGGASTPEQFWKLLSAGVDAIAEIPPDRFDLEALFDADPATPGKLYTRWGGFIDGIDGFDADFFGVAPREARRMDPQHRLLLEVVWEALADGGQLAERLAGTSTGVFVGIASHDYGDMQARPGRRHLIDAHVNIGSALCAAPNRISYLLDLHGPSLAVETACSSSLTALHLACRSVRCGESDLAIVGGVNLVLTPEPTIGFCKASMISPDGRCRAFDARANGYVRSEGAGAVVLKPLGRALVDGDRVYAVIRGSAINEDGRTAGISLPSGEAQEAVLRQALRDAGLTGDAVQYVEAHGTGTVAGDPIEAGALGRVFGSAQGAGSHCFIGSVKTNIGHLEAGAGIAGLIKAALALKHRQIPPNLHFEQPNPGIAFDELRLRVPTRLEPWPESSGLARAGVNSFGFGGSNAHVLLEEPPPATHRTEALPAPPHLLALSGRSPEALRASAERYVESLGADGAAAPGDVAYTAATRRTHHEHRLAVVAGDREEMVERLQAFLRGEERAEVSSGRAQRGRPPRLAFVFSGMGPQWWGMGRRLLETEPVYRAALEESDGILQRLAGWSLLEELGRDEADSRIDEADLGHVANCAVQVALAALWRSWGIEPDLVTGHSSGEMAAACVAGVLSLADALHLAYHRGRLQHTCSGTGGMLAAGVPADEARRLLEGMEDRVSLAAVNSPESVTLSGEVAALRQIAAVLERRERFARFLRVEVPYHAPQMEAIREPLLVELRHLSAHAAALPFVSALTGDRVDGPELDAGYWWRNVRETVRFDRAVDRLLEEGCDVFLEVGPHPVLSAYISEAVTRQGRTAPVLPTLRRGEDDRAIMLRSLAALHVRGRRIHWPGVCREGTCVPLPTYPWQRERYWLEPVQDHAGSPGLDTGHPLLGRRLHSPRPSWEGDLDDPRSRYLDEHRVQDSIVFPGAGYVEMMLAAAGRLWPGAGVSIENVSFRKLLFLEAAHDRLLQLHYQPVDAEVEIHSAPKSDPTAWSLHATARLRRHEDAPTPRHLDFDAARGRCPEEVAIEEHFRALVPRGIRYGKAFHGLRELRFGEDEAVARISLPTDVELAMDPYRIHPALLDAAFQVFALAVIRDRAGESSPGPVFPVGIAKATYRAAPGSSFRAYVVGHRSEGRLSEGDLYLIDDAGDVVASFEGFRMQVLDQLQSPDEPGWLYRLDWAELPAETAPAPAAPRLRSPREVSQTVEAKSAPPERDPLVFGYFDVAARLDHIAAGYAAAALVELGWRPGVRDGAGAAELMEACGVVARHRRLFPELLRMARQVTGEPEARPLSPTALGVALDELGAARPAYLAECQLLRRGGEHLADVLRGRVDAREILLSSEAIEILEGLYHASPECRSYSALVADAVETAIAAAPSAGPVRILEIGGGTGSATDAILRRLGDRAEYVFTDVSPFFVARARTRFGDGPARRFDTLDIEQDPVADGWEPHAYDVVVAADVLHATADLRTSLRHVGRFLKPDGLAVILELTHRADWFNLVFGLLDGWWRFSDHDLRSEWPLLGPHEWCGVLEESGFREATRLFDGETDGAAVQTVILARAPEAAVTPVGPGRSWLLLADDHGVAERLATAFRQRGDRCVIAAAAESYRRLGKFRFELAPDDPVAIGRLLEESRSPDGSTDGVIHLWSLDAPPVDDQDTASLMASQRFGSASALALVQALEHADTPAPAVWLVTAGAQRVEGRDVTPRLSQATLWGLGRVVMNEYAELRCRLVDLSPAPMAEELDALARLVRGVGADEEVAIRGDRRFARRLRRASLESVPRRVTPRQRSPAADAFRLECETPGALETLRLTDVPWTEPGPGEVAIRVEASALAFRDVLQTLGVYPERLLRSQPDPRALGADCAGIVLSSGEDVADFRPGDEVIAVGTGAHGSRIVAPAHLVVHKPAALSFAEAASIVNAFVTAKYSLEQVARIAPGERILIHSAAGGVGLAAVQVCRAVGAEIFATAGTPEKRDYLASLGVEHVMDSRSLAFADDVLTRTGGEGVDVVLNSLAGEAMRASLALLRPYGRFVELGKRDIYEDTQLGLLPFQRNLSYSAVDLAALAGDRPQLANALMREVVDEVEDGHWTLLPRTEFDLADAESAFRLMAQGRHIGKVVLVVGRGRYDVLPGGDPPLWRPEVTYLIAGGLGGFGLAAAEWLVARGATSIVLMSRSGVPKEDTGALNRLRKSAARVVVMRGDVGEEADVQRVLDRIRRELPPLGGVLHAAMVLDDRMLARIDGKRLHSVLSPKVAGAWNLHRMTLGDDLDHFILFSSLASVMGHPMQGSYAAANAFLDALASHRRTLGLPALAIGWGAVAGTGYVSRHPKVAEYLSRSGSGTFTAGEALETMEMLLRHDVAHVVAARIDWHRWAQSNSVVANSARYASVTEGSLGSGVATPEHSDSPLASLRDTVPERRQEALEAYLLQKLARVLGGDPQKIDLERPLTELGFDSLMAVELVTALQSDLGIKLPVVKILAGVSGRGLAETLLDQLSFDEAAGDPATATEGTAAEGAPVAESAGATPVVAGPLSFEQRRFWFLDRLSPGDPSYNLFAAARLIGALDREALQRGIGEVVRRHDVLRARFRSVDGEPRQVIGPPAPVPLALRDLSHHPREAREAELRQLATAELQQPFDLARGPLVRSTLFRLAQDEHAVLLVVHHAVADAWTVTLLVQEIMTVYGAVCRDERSALPEPETQYTEYVRAQRDALGEDVLEAQLAYWRDQLADLPPEVDLPSDRVRRERPGWRGGHHRFELSRELTESLQELGRRNGVTLFTTLLAAFQTLLHRYSGQNDICVGTPVATREREGEDALVGCCMNTLVLRTDLRDDPPFHELLGRAREATLGAFEHQDVPFERVVEAVAPSRRPLRSPLYTAMLVLHNLRWPELALPGLTVEPLELESGTAACDLMLLVDTGEQLQCTLEYSAELFDAATATRIAEHLRSLLEGIVADPRRRLSDLPLVPQAERRVLAGWNATIREFTGPSRVHELVEAQVVRTPEAVAVSSGETSLTYAELDRRADRLAERLRRLGIRPDMPVAVHSARSPHLLVGALAILKAGGAYLPLDPEQPLPRLSMMLEDAGARVLLTEAQSRLRLTAPGLEVVLLDSVAGAPGDGRGPTGETGAEAEADVGGSPASNVLAYVLYTSGTTGRPKGVAVPHRAICNQIRWRQAEFPLSADDVVLQRTPLAFDPSVWELFGPLAAGARLVLPPANHGGDPADLVRLIAAHAVTTLQVVPALLAALVEEPAFRECRSLARIFCGGDVLRPALAIRVREAAPWIELVNLYGPTEATIEATFWRCRDDVGEDRDSVPIGRPIANARAWVVDSALRPLPIGVAGELCISGAGVARGYLGRPDLTRERFVPDPFDTAADGRLYRTGDRARFRADGALEFLGRLDDQLKLRGTRIEPGEVLAALERHPAVREAAVLAMEDARGEGQLVACVVAAPGRPADDRMLRRFLQGHLPEAMIPSAFMWLERLPRTANGKLDRDALPELSRTQRTHRRTVPPRDPLEVRLVALWEALLGVAPVGVTDDFFALGGHSLLAARLAAEVSSAFGAQLPLAAVFAGPTIEELAWTLREQVRPSAKRRVIPLQSIGDGRPLFCVPAPTGAAWRYLPLARRLGTRRPIYALPAPGSEDIPEALPARIEDMARTCIEALRSVQPEGPYLLGGWSMGGTIAFEMARQLEAAGQDVPFLALLDTRATPPDAAALARADRAELLRRLLADLGLDRDRVAPVGDRFWKLEPDAQLAVVLERARAAEVLPAGSGIAELRRHLELLESSLAALRRYRPQSYRGRITVIRAATPRSATMDDPTLGWAPLAGGGVAVYSTPGDHDSMLREPHVRVLGRRLRTLLDAADRGLVSQAGSPANG